jgi:hypothetical protein
MIRLDFHKPLTALEIRDPIIGVCKEVASEFELYATFHQPQQFAFDGYSRQRGRKRIGNGKHKSWFINFQEDEPQVSRPTVVGKIALKAPIRPDEMQFGGFDYGKYGEPSPTYSYITVYTASEFTEFRPLDPSPDLLAMTYEGLKKHFEGTHLRLFDIAPYN